MAKGFSKAIIMGNLTRDPEMRATQNGANVCSFAVAVNRTYKDNSGNNVEQVSFIDCVAWGRLGETIAQYAKKGSGVLVSGRLNQRFWEDKAGSKRSSVEIVVEDFSFLPRGGQSSGSYVGGNNYSGDNNYTGAPASAPATSSAEVVPEDIPDEVDLGDIPF